MSITPEVLLEAGYKQVPLLWWVKDEPQTLEFKKYVRCGEAIKYIIEATYHPPREYGGNGIDGSSLGYTQFTVSLWKNPEQFECEIAFSAEDYTPPLTLEQCEAKIAEYHSLLECGVYCE